MTGQGRSTRAAIKELLAERTAIVEKLAGQLERYEAAKDAVAAAQAQAEKEAAAARAVYQEALDSGWTATELTRAGLKPPAPPRRRGSSAGDPVAADPVAADPVAPETASAIDTAEAPANAQA